MHIRSLTTRLIPLLVATLLGWQSISAYPESSKVTTVSENKPKLKSDAQIFLQDDSVPPGFEALDQEEPQTTLVSVYYGNRLVANSMAKFTYESLTFLDPQTLVDGIPNIKAQDKKIIESALSQSLATHSELLCRGTRRKLCKPLHPPIAGLIFDDADLKAHLFINPAYLDTESYGKSVLPPSTAGFSMVNTNSLLVSKAQTTTYSLNADNTLGYGNGYFLSNGFYTRDKNAAGQTQNALDINTLAGELLHHGSAYTAGVIPTGGNGMFTQTVSMIGAKYVSYKPVGTGSRLSQGTPVILYLPTDSTVEIYRRNELIYAQTLAAGKHEINTSRFPIGSYDITIKITNSLNEVTQQTQFYIKRSDGVEIDKPKYTFALGMIEKDDISLDQNEPPTVQWPQISNKPVFSIDRDSLLTPNTDMNLNLISDASQAYSSADFAFSTDHFSIEPGVQISSNQIYGIGSSAAWNQKRFHLGINFGKFYGLGQMRRAIDQRDFMPLSATDYRYGVNASTYLGGFNVTAYTQRQKPITGSASITTTIGLTRNLYNSQLTHVNFSATASKTSIDTIVSIGISASFTTAHIDGNAQFDYRRDNIGDASSQNSDSFSKNIGLHKSIKLAPKESFNWNAQASDTRTSRSYRGQMQYTSLPFQAGGSFTHNAIKTGDQRANNRYTANVSSSLVYADGSFGVGYSARKNTGVIVNIISPQPGQTDIMNQRTRIATVSNNYSTPIFLSPYQTYNLTINPLGAAAQFDYDTAPKNITLYRGNVQHLEWELTLTHILFAEIVDQNGNPIPNLLLKQKDKYNTTDDFGYIQSEIKENTKQLSFISLKGKTCRIPIPKDAKVDEGLMVLEKPLVCKLQDPKK